MILLDTHVVVWLAGRPERLSAAARKAILRESRRSGVSVASVTLLELAQLAAQGEILIPGSPTAWLRHLVAETGLVVRELTPDVAAVAAYLPPGFPGDPFDRVIAATAMVERMVLVTADVRIQRSRVVPTIW